MATGAARAGPDRRGSTRRARASGPTHRPPARSSPPKLLPDGPAHETAASSFWRSPEVTATLRGFAASWTGIVRASTPSW